MVVIAIFRVIKAPFIDGNLSIIDCYAEAVHVFRNFVHVIKNRLVGAPVHVIEKTVHVHENCCSRVLRILNEVLLNRGLVQCDVVEEAAVRLLRNAVRIGGAMTELPGFETGKFRPVRHETVLRDCFDLERITFIEARGKRLADAGTFSDSMENLKRADA